MIIGPAVTPMAQMPAIFTLSIDLSDTQKDGQTDNQTSIAASGSLQKCDYLLL